MRTPDFIVSTKGLEASFRIINKVPEGSIILWDFGDGSEDSGSKFVTHTYSTPGIYTVVCKVAGKYEIVKNLVISDKVKTHLSDTIYNLIDSYIPSDFGVTMGDEDKSLYINKWQLYIQPLVNHCIPLEEYSNELYYEGLENQLIMELAVYDFLYTYASKMIISTTGRLQELISNSSKTSEGSSGEEGLKIKQITTGPTEVQYFDSMSDSISSLYKYYVQSLQPGGFLDQYKTNLCMLASRLEIFLPICGEISKEVVVPSVGNHRRSKLLGGPNPATVLGGPPDTSLIPE